MNVKKKAIFLLYSFFYFIGFIPLLFWLTRNKFTAISYHNIIPDHLFDHTPHLGMSLPVTIFEKQIQFLKKYKNRILITFDDGYKNQASIAANILEKYKLRGLFFISFSLLETGKVLIIDNIMKWVSYVPEGNYKINDFSFGLNSQNRHEIMSEIYMYLLENVEVWFTIESQLSKQFSFTQLSFSSELDDLRFTPINVYDIERLKAKNHLIGAHSFDHLPLSTLPIDKQEDDFSKSFLYAKKYSNTLYYSYPFGGVTEVSSDTIQLCQKYGFENGFMNISEIVGSQHNQEFIKPRLSLGNECHPIVLMAKLSGFEYFLKMILSITTKKIRDLNGNKAHIRN